MTAGKYDLEKMTVCNSYVQNSITGLGYPTTGKEKGQCSLLCVIDRRHSGGLIMTWSSWIKV